LIKHIQLEEKPYPTRWQSTESARANENANFTLAQAPTFPFMYGCMIKLDHADEEGSDTIRIPFSLNKNATNSSKIAVLNLNGYIYSKRTIYNSDHNITVGALDWNKGDLFKVCVIEHDEGAIFYLTKSNYANVLTDTNSTPLSNLHEYTNVDLNWFNGIISNVILFKGTNIQALKSSVIDYMNADPSDVKAIFGGK